MSLFNREGNTPDTIIIREITRSRNESFGDSFMKDAALAADQSMWKCFAI